MKKFLPYILIVLVLAVAAVFIWKNKPNKSYMADTSYKSYMTNTTDDSSSPAPSSQSSAAPTANSFTDPDFGFSFKYPSDIRLGRFEEGDGVNILLSKQEQSVAQIYITSFDEAGPITSARIKKDLPDKIINNPGNTKIGGNDVYAFFSKAEDGSEVREYWFVNNKNLYRVTTPKQQDELTQKILATWENE